MKRQSRRDRCDAVMGHIQKIKERLEEAKEGFDKEVETIEAGTDEEKEFIDRVVSEVNTILADLEYSDIENLFDEIDTWASGMEGTNLETTQKYETLDECRNALDNARGHLDGIDLEGWDTLREGETADDLLESVDSIIEDLGNADDELQGCEFPGMFG